jgi:small subunit ribosomal protein S6
MQKYELLLILPGTLDDIEAEKRLGEVVEVVKEHSGSVETNNQGKNRLAYPVKQIRYGYFYTIVFEAEPAKARELQDKLRLMRDLLRAMITHFNTNVSTSQKINYTTNAIGVTTMQEQEEPVKKEEKKEEIDVEDINKKLDEILDGNIISNS